jgi:hypothetical protein
VALTDQQAVVWQRGILLAGLAAVLFAVGLSLVPFSPPLAASATGRTLETGCGPAVVSVFDDDAPTIRQEEQAFFGGPVLACRDEARRRLVKSGIVGLLAAAGVVLGTLVIGRGPRRPAVARREEGS